MCFGMHYAQSNSSLRLVHFGETTQMQQSRCDGQNNRDTRGTLCHRTQNKKGCVYNTKCGSGDCVSDSRSELDTKWAAPSVTRSVSCSDLMPAHMGEVLCENSEVYNEDREQRRTHKNKGRAAPCARIQIWLELSKRISEGVNRQMCVSQTGLIPGLIVNSVNGGYAVAIGGYIAFLPKTLRFNSVKTRKVWGRNAKMSKYGRLSHLCGHDCGRELMCVYSIVKMTPQIKNIVVREMIVPYGTH
jgi:hypothetical protein